MSSVLLVALFVAASARTAAAAAPTVTWGALTTGGTFKYIWTLQKTVNSLAPGGVAVVRVQMGETVEVPYTLAYTRTIDQTSAALTVSGSLTVANANAAGDPGANGLTVTAVTVSLTPSSGGGSPSTVTPTCAPPLGSPLAPGATTTCTFTNAPITGFVTTGTASATITYTDASPDKAGPSAASDAPAPFTFGSVQGQFATALLTDKFDLTPLDALYTGFTGFVRDNVWRAVDPATAIPAAGLTVSDSDTKRYTIRAGAFVTCTSAAGVTISNTATLTPQQAGTTGVPIPQTASVTLQIWGCDLPPDVNFQNLQTWGAQTFTWTLAKRATRSAFTVDQNAGSVPIEYTVTPRAAPSTGSYAVSGAVFVNNVQPGILNIARLFVQLSTGQSAIPTCSLTTPYVAADGLVWGGANAGGSITTTPFATTGLPLTTNALAAATTGTLGIGTGVFNQFVLPRFNSATCTFNISLGNQMPGAAVQITPMLNWGFGGMYTLNQPAQLTLNFNPPDHFFPVGGCVSITDVAQAGAITLANGGPNNQQFCVTGNAPPFAQPAPVTYTVTATINPTTTFDCTPGGVKTYSVSNTATATPLGGASSTPVTATSDPPVTINVNCAKAAPSVTPVTPQSVGGGALNVQVGNFQTYVGSDTAWTVAKSVDDDTLTLRIGDPPKTAKYTLQVTKLPPTDSKFFVAGQITVTNPGAAPVLLSAVSVTAGSAAVPATCPPDASSVSPGLPVVCTFNVSWNNGAVAGALGARVDTPEASFTGGPGQFDFTNPKRTAARGNTVDITDDFNGTAPAGATGVPTRWFVPDANAPPSAADGVPLTTADSQTYTYTVQLGPFADKGSCGTYKLANTATVRAADAPARAKAQAATALLALSVTGCSDTELQSVDATKSDATAAVTGVTVARVTATSWAVNGSVAPASLPAAGGDAAFSFTFAKVPAAASYEVAGSVTLANKNPAAGVQVTGVTVAIEATNGPARTVDATCGAQGSTFTLAAGNSVACTFTTTIDADGPGTITAVATDAAGKHGESAPTPYATAGAPAKAAGDAPACAQITYGMVTGVPLLAADGAPVAASTSRRVCDSETVSVPVAVPPLAAGACGAQSVTALATAVPVAATPTFISTAVTLPVAAPACAGDAAPAVTAAPPKVAIREAYSWSAKLTSDATKPLVVPLQAPAKVTFVADSQRSAAKLSAGVSGSVTLEAPGAMPLTVASAQVAVYDGSARATLVPLNCTGAPPGGPVKLNGRGAPVTCTYAAAGLAVADGAVVPVIRVDADGPPAAAAAAAYSMKGAARDVVGDCADLGSSITLAAAGGGRAPWQPAFAGQALSSGSDCDGGDLQRFTLVFGGNAQGAPLAPPPACGEYTFTASLTLLPTNGDASTATESFPVRVTGC